MVTRSVLASVMLLAPVVHGCADDLRDDAPTPPPAATATPQVSHDETQEDVVTTRVDATAGEWVYLDLSTKAQATPAAPETSGDWDLAFRLQHIKLNGGVSGKGDVSVAILEGVDFAAVTTAPTDGYISDAADGSDPGADPDYAMGGWYQYDSTTHTLTARPVVYVLRSVEGQTYKLQMLSYYDDAGTARHPSFQWAPLP